MVTWSVFGCISYIDFCCGPLTAVSNGEVIVKAMAKDGSGISSEKN